MPSVPQQFGIQVRSLRKERGWSQERLAAESGKHPTYIGGIERGTRNPTITVAAEIAHALGVPLARLFEVDDAPRVGNEAERPCD